MQAEEGKNGNYTEVTGRKPEVGTGGGYQLFLPRETDLSVQRTQKRQRTQRQISWSKMFGQVSEGLHLNELAGARFGADVLVFEDPGIVVRNEHGV